MFNKIVAHTSFLGHTGYANHSREFFTRLNKHIQTRVRNFAHCSDLSYLTEEQKDMIIHQRWNEPPWEVGRKHIKRKTDNILNIILNETNHYFFYDDYIGPTIAYNVWESTLQPEQFFKKLLEFDQLWVPTQWQKDVTIKQGYPENKIKVIPEGIDTNKLFPIKKRKLKKFKFIVVGRWDYRKSITEVIQAFLSTFKKNENVELLLLIDNPFLKDGLTTKERLKKFGFIDKRIKISGFMDEEKYIKTLQNSDCLITCARSEGWNIPLCEAMACGIPVICSDYGAQLEFADKHANKVRIKDYRKPKEMFMFNEGDEPGLWSEPDFEHLKEVIRYVYENYSECEKKAKLGAKYIRKNFAWKKAIDKALYEIEELSKTISEPIRLNFGYENITKKDYINIKQHFVDGPFIDLLGKGNKEYSIEFYDNDNKSLVYSIMLTLNHWTRPYRKYFTNWKVTVKQDGEEVYKHDFDAKGKRVYIHLDSKSLGDTIAWFSYVEEFRKKHESHIIVSTFWNQFFQQTYPKIEFIPPGQRTENLYASYSIGCREGIYDNKRKWNTIPLQTISSDFLGLDYKEIKPIIYIPDTGRRIKGKYVCISEHSTAGCKYWNHTGGWQKIVNYLNEVGYKVVVISKEKTLLKNIINKTNQTIENTIANLKYASCLLVGPSGLGWLAWAIGIPVIMISGISYSFYEFQQGRILVQNTDVCHGCFTDSRFQFDKGDWNWCPKHKGTKRQFECTKKIYPKNVIEAIKKTIKVNNDKRQ